MQAYLNRQTPKEKRSQNCSTTKILSRRRKALRLFTKGAKSLAFATVVKIRAFKLHKWQYQKLHHQDKS
jgi:hypothetical protein